MDDRKNTLKVYYLPKRKIVYGLSLASATLALAPLILHVVFSGKYTGDSGSWLVVTVLFGFFAIWAFLWGLHSKLVLSQNGIEIHDIANLLCIKTEWTNIAKMDKFGSKTYLILVEPASPASKLTEWLFSKGFIVPGFLDISDYSDYLHNGNLKNEIAIFAPSLFS